MNEQPILGVISLLDLGHNQIDDVGFQYCLDILEEDIGLKELLLNNNQIKGRKLKNIQLAGLHSRLVRLSVYQNPIGDFHVT
jgi:hypothetical protein